MIGEKRNTCDVCNSQQKLLKFGEKGKMCDVCNSHPNHLMLCEKGNTCDVCNSHPKHLILGEKGNTCDVCNSHPKHLMSGEKMSATAIQNISCKLKRVILNETYLWCRRLQQQQKNLWCTMGWDYGNVPVLLCPTTVAGSRKKQQQNNLNLKLSNIHTFFKVNIETFKHLTSETILKTHIEGCFADGK